MSSAADARYPGLDTLRAAAIGAVMVFHLLPVLPPPLEVFGRFGWMGVDLFFVLSGFLIGSQLLRPVAAGLPVRIGAFYRRRAYRILPAYFTVVALYLFIPGWRERAGLPAAWKLLTFTSNLWMNYPAELAFSHSWSLCIEEHFYLVLPVLVVLLTRKPSLRKTVIVSAAVLMLGIGVRWWELTHVVKVDGLDDEAWPLFMKRLYYPTYSRLDGLLCGVALAAVRTFRPGWWTRLTAHGTTMLVAGAAFLVMGWGLFGFDYPSPDRALGTLVGFPLISAGFALWVAAAVAKNGPFTRRVLGAKAVATLAFSLYLTHKGAAHVAARWIPRLEESRSWAAAVAYLAICMGLAAALYFLVERPFLWLRDRRSARATDVDASARLEPGL